MRCAWKLSRIFEKRLPHIKRMLPVASLIRLLWWRLTAIVTDPILRPPKPEPSGLKKVISSCRQAFFEATNQTTSSVPLPSLSAHARRGDISSARGDRTKFTNSRLNMSPRGLLASAFRQCKSCLSQQHTTLFSTSSRVQGELFSFDISPRTH